MERDEAIRLLREHSDELTQRGVVSISIFGSVARNEARPESDVDILVEFQKPVPFSKFFELQEFLERLLGRPVDLVTPNGLKRQLKERILQEAVRAA